MKVVVVGAEGFVGSAFVRYLSGIDDVELLGITRRNFDDYAGTQSDITIDASCNSKKYLADENPVNEFKQSVEHRLRTVLSFPSKLQVHISSVDVYSNLDSPAITKEDSAIDLHRVSNYGFHKLLAEQIVQHYSGDWLIFRLAGMVGAGLRKNPVFDILNRLPLRIHPDSLYQFMPTDEVARITWSIIGDGYKNSIYNLCGDGLISPRQISDMLGLELDLSLLADDASPRVVDVSINKIKENIEIPLTVDAVRSFVEGFC